MARQDTFETATAGRASPPQFSAAMALLRQQLQAQQTRPIPAWHFAGVGAVINFCVVAGIFYWAGPRDPPPPPPPRCTMFNTYYPALGAVNGAAISGSPLSISTSNQYQVTGMCNNGGIILAGLGTTAAANLVWLSPRHPPGTAVREPARPSVEDLQAGCPDAGRTRGVPGCDSAFAHAFLCRYLTAYYAEKPEIFAIRAAAGGKPRQCLAELRLQTDPKSRHVVYSFKRGNGYPVGQVDIRG